MLLLLFCFVFAGHLFCSHVFSIACLFRLQLVAIFLIHTLYFTCIHVNCHLHSPWSYMHCRWALNKSSLLLSFINNYSHSIKTNAHGLTFTWWECRGLCLRRKPTDLAHSFLFCSCVCFCLYGPFNFISFHKFFLQLCFLTLFFWPYFCFISPFNYISLYDSLPRSWFSVLCGGLVLKH